MPYVIHLRSCPHDGLDFLERDALAGLALKMFDQLCQEDILLVASEVDTSVNHLPVWVQDNVSPQSSYIGGIARVLTDGSKHKVRLQGVETAEWLLAKTAEWMV